MRQQVTPGIVDRLIYLQSTYQASQELGWSGIVKVSRILLHPPVQIIVDNVYYIPVNTTLFLAGGVCCLGRHV
jgi:hypothetical protein